MKTKEDYKKMEYAALRNEQNQRINFMYTHGISTFTVVIAVLSINMGLFESLYNIVNELIEKLQMYYIGIILMQEMLFFVPMCMVLPASIKTGENLHQIALIGIYTKVAYEEKFDDVVLWEGVQHNLSDAQSNKKVMSIFNLEYCILVLISALLLLFF